MDIVEVAERTYRIEARPPGSPFRFSVYFITECGGVIIEPGPAVMVPAIEEAMSRLGMVRVEFIIPTHIHVDHGGAIGTLSGVFPESWFVLNERGARHAADPERLIRSTRMSFGDDYESIFGPISPVPFSRIRTVHDGDTLSVGSRELSVFETTGHAPHHISILDNSTGGLFCGESLGLVYGRGEPPLPATTLPSFDLDVYLSGMRRMLDLNPRILFYSHLGISREPTESIETAIENTIAFGDIVREAMSVESSDEALLGAVGERLKARLGVTLDDYELASNTHAFEDYFRRTQPRPG